MSAINIISGYTAITTITFTACRILYIFIGLPKRQTEKRWKHPTSIDDMRSLALKPQFDTANDRCETMAVADGFAYDELESRQAALAHCNRVFATLAAEKRVEWALEHLPGQHVLSSSFGAQAAVSLHMVTRHQPDIPVIFIDTGYLFPETYEFVEQLTERLDLNLNVYSSKLSPAWQEALYGERWNLGVEGLAAYNRENKVEPMERALRELNTGTWLAGLRREQARSRAAVPFLSWSGDRWKVHPIADWKDRDIFNYLKRNDLPYHPLWEKGYVSIGDIHTTRSLKDVDHIDETRFFGLTRECGLHDIDLSTI